MQFSLFTYYTNFLIYDISRREDNSGEVFIQNGDMEHPVFDGRQVKTSDSCYYYVWRSLLEQAQTMHPAHVPLTRQTTKIPRNMCNMQPREKIGQEQLLKQTSDESLTAPRWQSFVRILVDAPEGDGQILTQSHPSIYKINFDFKLQLYTSS